MDRTSAPSCAKRAGGRQQCLVGRLGHASRGYASWMSVAKMSFTRGGMAGQGFEGFLAISHLRRSRLAEVPLGAGVYLVMCSTASRPAFLATSAGGWFKGKDPTVPVSVLEARWIKPAEVLYIGKANDRDERPQRPAPADGATARLRLGQASRPPGRPLSVAGPELDAFLLAWRTTDDPTAEENRLLAAFFEIYGAYPFANIAGPRA